MNKSFNAKVTLLPTNNPLRVGHILTYTDGKDTRFLPLATKAGSTTWTGENGYQAHELYFTVSDKPKPNDYCLYFNISGEFQFIERFDNSEIHNPILCQKIIATTSTTLPINYPKPNIQFIQEYIDLNGIDEVSIEYTNRCCGRCDGVHDLCFTDTECSKHFKLGCTDCFGPRGDVIKVNSDNEMTINYNIKNNWSTNEVINLFKKFRMDTRDSLTEIFDEELDKWLKVNLK